MKLFCGLAFLSLLMAGCHSSRAPEPTTGPHFRVMTYNVNWGGAGADAAVEIIRRSGADIVCLQKTTPAWEQLLGAELRGEYPFAEFRSSEGRAGGGLAFLSKRRGGEIAYVPSNTGWFDGWIKIFETPIGPVQVLNVHLRPPVSDGGGWVSGYFSTRDDRVREMERFFDRRDATLPILVAGDFNDGEDSRVVHWLEKRGMVNALPQFDSSTATWEWRTSVATLRRRMDHIVYSSALHCSSARVIRAGGSDHFPVEGVFAASLRASK